MIDVAPPERDRLEQDREAEAHPDGDQDRKISLRRKAWVTAVAALVAPSGEERQHGGGKQSAPVRLAVARLHAQRRQGVRPMLRQIGGDHLEADGVRAAVAEQIAEGQGARMIRIAEGDVLQRRVQPVRQSRTLVARLTQAWTQAEAGGFDAADEPGQAQDQAERQADDGAEQDARRAAAQERQEPGSETGSGEGGAPEGRRQAPQPAACALSGLAAQQIAHQRGVTRRRLEQASKDVRQGFAARLQAPEALGVAPHRAGVFGGGGEGGGDGARRGAADGVKPILPGQFENGVGVDDPRRHPALHDQVAVLGGVREGVCGIVEQEGTGLGGLGVLGHGNPPVLKPLGESGSHGSSLAQSRRPAARAGRALRAAPKHPKRALCLPVQTLAPGR
ncbi:MAG: hypothetical protein ACK4M2_00455 [Brevundimonas sp.]